MLNSDTKKQLFCIYQEIRERVPMQYISDSKTLEKINEIDLAEAVSVREKMRTSGRMPQNSYLDGEKIEHKRAKEIANEGMDCAQRN